MEHIHTLASFECGLERLRRGVMSALQGKTAVVTGGSQGFGRAIVEALAREGMHVVAVARGKERLAALQHEVPGDIRTLSADVADPVAAGQIMQDTRPHVLVLNAGARPLLRPILRHSWETFSLNWETDVKAAFLWTHEAVTLPLDPGSVVIVMSSGAALQGSPLSGGYAGAKATQWLLVRYLAEESRSQGLGTRFHALLPRMTPETDLGSAAVTGYASRAGMSREAFLQQMGPPLTPATVGESVLAVLTDPTLQEVVAFQVTAGGLQPVNR
jgi:NAD(P)-dependent dehydrogenase (short-subunit alcohol dehydrogenase family)